jgi:hypothetical protein
MIELNQIIETRNINPDKKYIIFCDIFSFLNQIYNKIFPKIALQIYHHIIIKDLIPQLVVVRPLQFEFTTNHLTSQPVINAKKACPNSCIKVTNKFTG